MSNTVTFETRINNNLIMLIFLGWWQQILIGIVADIRHEKNVTARIFAKNQYFWGNALCDPNL